MIGSISREKQSHSSRVQPSIFFTFCHLCVVILKCRTHKTARQGKSNQHSSRATARFIGEENPVLLLDPCRKPVALCCCPRTIYTLKNNEHTSLTAKPLIDLHIGFRSIKEQKLRDVQAGSLGRASYYPFSLRRRHV